MTEINGNNRANKPVNLKKSVKPEKTAEQRGDECPKCASGKVHQTDLDMNPKAVHGRSAVKTSSMQKPWQTPEDSIQKDLQRYQQHPGLVDAACDLFNLLIDHGASPEEAADQMRAFYDEFAEKF